MKKVCWVLLFFMIFSCGLQAQKLVPQSPFVLNLDYANFRNTDESGYVEIYYGFNAHLLTYHWEDDMYRAGVTLNTQIKDEATQSLVVDENVCLPVAVRDTSDAGYRFPFMSQAGYGLPFGEYTLEVTATDSLNDDRNDRATFKLNVGPIPSETACSDLELCSRISSSTNQNDPFYKNRLEVVPNPTLVYGTTAYPVIFHYLELYNLNPEQEYTTISMIIGPDGSVVKQSSKKKKYGVNAAVELGTTNVTSIYSGKYQFRFALMDETGAEVTRSDKMFFVFNPNLVRPEETALTFQASVLQEFSEKELDNEWQQASYIATTEEKRLYKQLDTEVGKREFLGNFWGDLLKGRAGNDPILRDDYLRSVEIANEEYSKVGKPGWKTDRGRVYIMYGKPEYIERFQNVAESKPHEIWNYYDIEGGVIFVFIDRRGFGDMDLVHSTKRGELQYANWEEYLR